MISRSSVIALLMVAGLMAGVAAAAYGYSTATTTIQQHMINITPNITTMVLVGKAFANINASSNSYTTLSLNNTYLKMNVVVNSGAYALVNGTRVPDYNFSVLLFQTEHIGVPNSNYTSTGLAFAFAVNGKVNESIQLVDSAGSPDAPVTTVYAPSNWTSWTYLGGSFNGTNYNGGSFAFPNTWDHVNGSVMKNTQFYAAVPWVFLAARPVAQTTTVQTTAQTTAPTTVATTTISPVYKGGSSAAYEDIAIGAVVIIIIAVLAYLALRRR